MKKLLFLFALLPVLALGQTQTITKKFITNMTRTADTSVSFAIGDNYAWQVHVVWSSNDGTTSTVKMQQSVDGSHWTDLPISAGTITGTTGSISFEDSFSTALYYRLYIDMQSGKTSIFNCWYNLRRKL